MEIFRTLIKEFSSDIRISFGLNKRAVIKNEKGKMIDSPVIMDIPTLASEDSYRYLGFFKGSKIIHNKSKDDAKKELLSRIRNILKKVP